MTTGRLWLGIAFAALALVACGQSDEDQVRESVDQFYADLSSGEAEPVCAVLTDAGSADVELLASLTAIEAGREIEEGCEDAVTSIAAGDMAEILDSVDAEDVDVGEQEATVETDEGFEVELVKEGDDWLIDSPGLSEAALSE